MVVVHDKILDAYFGKMGEQFMRDTQKRVHWVCSQVRGEKILDVGCSQGIVPVLLGKEGKNVIGIDIDESAVEDANNFLVTQPSETRKKVHFENVDFLSYDFNGETYDTVIMSEVLEHLTRPKDFVKYAYELIEKDGKFIITVPFGINDFIDHKHTFYALEPLRLLWDLFEIDDVEIFGKWIGFSCTKRDSQVEDYFSKWPWSLVRGMEVAFQEIERFLIDKNATFSKNLKEANEKYKESIIQLNDLKDKFKKTSSDLVISQNLQTETSADLNALTEELGRTKQRGDDFEEKYFGIKKELAQSEKIWSEIQAKTNANLAKITEELGRARQRGDDFEGKYIGVKEELSQSEKFRFEIQAETNADLAKITEELGRAKQRGDDFEEKYIGVKEELAQLEKFRTEIDEKLASTTEALKKAKEECARFEQELVRRGHEKQVHDLELAETKTFLEQTRSRLTESERKFTEAKQVQIQLQWLVKEGEGKQSELERQLAEANKKLHLNSHKIGHLGSQLSTARAQIKDTKTGLIGEFKSSYTWRVGRLFTGAIDWFLKLLKSPITLFQVAVGKQGQFSKGNASHQAVDKARPAQVSKKPLKEGGAMDSPSIKKKEIRHGSNLRDGVTVIIPTYKGEETILNCLNSFGNQTLSNGLFEILIIINGEKDSSEQIIEKFIKANPSLNCRVFILETTGASIARNKGLEEAKYKYIVFVDDDDKVSSNYLEELYGLSGGDTVVITRIADIYADGGVDYNNSISSQIDMASIVSETTCNDVAMVLTINACKLIPASLFGDLHFDSALNSGEDVVLFSEIVARFKLKYKIVPALKKATYFRTIREKSVSRQETSFYFNVQQRLEVIQRLDKLLNLNLDQMREDFIKGKIRAQANFVNIYNEEFPSHYLKILDEVNKYELSYFPLELIKKRVPSSLVIAYCFPPYVDTSGTVMAKRINVENEFSDVICNNMINVRSVDQNLNHLVEHIVEDCVAVNSPTSFANWDAIKIFCELAKKEINNLENKKGAYKRIYSRALWPASHFAAFEYKVKRPGVIWVAEFSDPVLYDIHGDIRDGCVDGRWLDNVQNLFQEKGLPHIENSNLFFWCECIAYCFADELIFTNKNQLQYMVNNFPEPEIKELVYKKAKISPHPTLPAKFYYLFENGYALDKSKINMAYFGAFYKTRNLDDVLEGLRNLTKENRERFQFHIFTQQKDIVEEVLAEDILRDCIKINDYVSYCQFLNLTTKFDCLVVNDAVTFGLKEVNPYLPSKISDYLGSNVPIWALYEEGSTLSNYKSISYKSRIGETREAIEVLTGSY